MVFLAFIGFLYPPPTWKAFLFLFKAREVPQKIFFQWWLCTLFFLCKGLTMGRFGAVFGFLGYFRFSWTLSEIFMCFRAWRARQAFSMSGLKNTRPFRFLLLKSVVLDWFMVSSCLFRWSLACQNLAVNTRNRAKTTRIK